LIKEVVKHRVLSPASRAAFLNLPSWFEEGCRCFIGGVVG
jgi:hypothetical protein